MTEIQNKYFPQRIHIINYVFNLKRVSSYEKGREKTHFAFFIFATLFATDVTTNDFIELSTEIFFTCFFLYFRVEIFSSIFEVISFAKTGRDFSLHSATLFEVFLIALSHTLDV